MSSGPADLLITSATVLRVGNEIVDVRGDVRVVAGRIAGVGGVDEHVRRTARTVIDGAGATVVPLVVQTLEEQRAPAERFRDKEIAAGNEATFAVVGRPVSRREAGEALIVRPADLRAVVLAGAVEVRDGEVRPGAARMAPLAGADPRLGTWIDRTGYLHQALDAAGRYDETRNGRRHAYQGQYWVKGARIVYLDDTGFWAFGEFTDTELHHAGYVMSRG